MGLNETEAFVLRTYKLAEADRIAVLLTQKFGLLRGVARGARKLKSRFGASLEPYTFISLSYYEKEAQELVSIRQAEIVRSYFHLAREPEVVATLGYLSELIIEFAPPHEPNERLFRLIKACLSTLNTTPTRLEEVVRYFEVWILKLSGFLPDIKLCANCRQTLQGSTFLTLGHRLECAHCAHSAGLRLSADAMSRLRALLNKPPGAWANAGSAAEPESTRQELGQFTRQLITRALERVPRGQSGPPH
jgi:DNA repair protein RecO (recombination protein O)